MVSGLWLYDSISDANTELDQKIKIQSYSTDHKIRRGCHYTKEAHRGSRSTTIFSYNDVIIIAMELSADRERRSQCVLRQLTRQPRVVLTTAATSVTH